MKKLVHFIFSLFFLILPSIGQDIIETNDGNEIVHSDYKGTHFMLGIGAGNSYGNIGVKAQYRFGIGQYQGLGIHAGLGYEPDVPVRVSGGLKYFPYSLEYLVLKIVVVIQR